MRPKKFNKRKKGFAGVQKQEKRRRASEGDFRHLNNYNEDYSSFIQSLSSENLIESHQQSSSSISNCSSSTSSISSSSSIVESIEDDDYVPHLNKPSQTVERLIERNKGNMIFDLEELTKSIEGL